MKKWLGIGLMVLGLFGLVFGAVAAYQGVPGPNPEVERGTTPMAYAKGCGHANGGMMAAGGGVPYMGLGVKSTNLTEVSIDPAEVQDYLGQVSVEEFTNPRGVTVQKLVYDGDYVGKVVGDYDLSELDVYAAYETLNGVKVFLAYEGNIVGFVLMK
ncbi:hypothetical protein TON_0787 [Thermococcus onnurineus NA1]|uniref:Uncharacterized protein n=1 Tax=Thermococcus onnurineus (strain NA1) TaxID=523850 RepID=B6YVV2_THEON|nr:MULTISPECIES: hypothetical protein [Thermococcus]ACJ16275.1 hypothetical protein TON_0787 [Thermococcus onnurineus NA1]NJE47633.1 hypothetical protein [Thermococcus sp. GR7]NJE78953.1 hypothetical protein [Thermococcus sp. GR4]NJF22603.1 hypothetical protein [Thermococcus sp. GR5]